MAKPQVKRPAPAPTIMPLPSRDGRPTYRTTFQINCLLNCHGSRPNGDPFADARAMLLAWMQRRFTTRIPNDAMEGAPFELDEGVRRVECASVSAEGLWAAHMHHADEPFGNIPAVPGRNWIVDAALRRQNGQIRMGMRIVCVSSSFSQQGIALSRPRVISDLAQKCQLFEVRPLNAGPWTLQTDADLGDLHALLTSPARTLPVILLTQPDQRLHRVPVSPFLLDGDALARQLLGLAHVVQLPHLLGFRWTERVGKPWTAFLGAVRTYLPGVDFINGSPGEHPFATAERIIFWQHNGLSSEAAFEAFLAEEVARQNAFKRLDWDGNLFLADVKGRHAELLRKAATEAADWHALYREDLAAKDAKISQLEREKDDAFGLAAEFERLYEANKNENDKLRFQIDQLRHRLADKIEGNPDASIDLPATYEALAEWVDANLAGRLVFLSRAKNALKDAKYADLNHLCQSLLLLAGPYRDMRLGLGSDGEHKNAFEKRLEELHLRCSPAISRARAGEEGDTYFVEFPLGSGQRQFLELHLRSQANSRQPERCLAIYFFWHPETRQIVVGWLPGHLDIRCT